MDPLTITLAVVTFTTALKDIIELSQKIEQSFSKVRSTLFVILDASISHHHGVGITKHAERSETGGWGTSRFAPSAGILRRKFCDFEHFQRNAGSAGNFNEVSPLWDQLYRLYGAHGSLERWKFQSRNAMISSHHLWRRWSEGWEWRSMLGATATKSRPRSWNYRTIFERATDDLRSALDRGSIH